MIRSDFDFPASSNTSDECLMRAITDRDQSALNELYSRYGGRLKSMIGTIIHEEGEADDVVQDIMIQIWREARKYSPKAGKPIGWITTLARRRAIDRLRRRQAYSRTKDRFADHSQQSLSGDGRTASVDEISRSDLREFLNEQLLRLPPFQGQVVRLAFYRGMSQREIATATRTPLGTVKTRLELGLRKLAGAMRPLRHKI